MNRLEALRILELNESYTPDQLRDNYHKLAKEKMGEENHLRDLNIAHESLTAEIARNKDRNLPAVLNSLDQTLATIREQNQISREQISQRDVLEKRRESITELATLKTAARNHVIRPLIRQRNTLGYSAASIAAAAAFLSTFQPSEEVLGMLPKALVVQLQVVSFGLAVLLGAVTLSLQLRKDREEHRRDLIEQLADDRQFNLAALAEAGIPFGHHMPAHEAISNLSSALERIRLDRDGVSFAKTGEGYARIFSRDPVLRLIRTLAGRHDALPSFSTEEKSELSRLVITKALTLGLIEQHVDRIGDRPIATYSMVETSKSQSRK